VDALARAWLGLARLEPVPDSFLVVLSSAWVRLFLQPLRLDGEDPPRRPTWARALAPLPESS